MKARNEHYLAEQREDPDMDEDETKDQMISKTRTRVTRQLRRHLLPILKSKLSSNSLRFFSHRKMMQVKKK